MWIYDELEVVEEYGKDTIWDADYKIIRCYLNPEACWIKDVPPADVVFYGVRYTTPQDEMGRRYITGTPHFVDDYETARQIVMDETGLIPARECYAECDCKHWGI